MTKEIIGGRYEVQSRLGRGGMASVYLALDTRLKREVAIKVVRESRGRIDSDFYFLREARSAAALRHNNIVQIYDYSGPDESPIFLVMELVDGRTLDDIIDERKSLYDELAICITRGIAGALEHAHGRGVIHRDIKPGNVMIESTGRVLLTDFGIAKPYGQAELGDTLAGRKTALVGTPSYMAPEHIADQDVGPAADVFALGAMIYGMLVGHSPFAAQGVVEVFRRIIDGEYTPLAEARPKTAAPIANLVSDCLQRDPRRRPTMIDVVHSCEELFHIYRVRDVERRITELLGLDRTVISDQFEIPQEVRTLTQPDGDASGEKTVQSRPDLVAPSAGESEVEFDAPRGLETTRIEDGRVEPTVRVAGLESTTDVHGSKRRALFEQVMHTPTAVYALSAALGISALIIGIGMVARRGVSSDFEPAGPVGTVQTPVEATELPLPRPVPEPVPQPESSPPTSPPPSEAIPVEVPEPDPLQSSEPRRERHRKRPATTRGRAVIELKVIPWGKIFVDGVEKGNAPVVRTIQLPAGKHSVTVTHPALGKRKQTIVLKGGERKTLRFDLTQEP